MTKIDEFKNFVKKNPSLITKVNNNEMTWQKYYELYDLYGEKNDIWNDYINIKKEDKKENTSTSKFSELLNMAKNVDVDKVQNGITSLQKAIGLFGDLIVNKDSNSNTNTNTSSYQPRPVYRNFDD